MRIACLVHVVHEKIMRILTTLEARLRFMYWGVAVGPGFRINGRMRLVNHGCITLGSRVRMNSGRGNFVGGIQPMSIWVGPGAILALGDRTGVSNTTIVSVARVSIGADTYIGGGCEIYDTDFHPLVAAERAVPGAPGASAEVVIGRSVFIGARCIILKGTVIGDNSVIGAGSVVVGCIPANELWAGVPARKIRQLA